MSADLNAAAFADAREVCHRHARSFYFASRFLPRERRDAAYAVYAFCRQMDDAVDEAASPEIARQNLQSFKLRLDDTFASPCTRGEGGGEGLAVHPTQASLNAAETLSPRTGRARTQRAFELTVQKYQLPRQPFLDLLAGCEMDLSISRYANWAELDLYCYRVAGVVGLIMSRIFGLERESAQRQAVLMGNAMQLTNILRDVGEDFSSRGRVYLPLDELDRFGYSVDQLSRGVVNTAFIELMRFQIARARAMFQEASDGLCYLAADGSRLTATTMAVIYSGILNAIERQHYDVFTQRARLTLPQKIARLPRCWKLASRKPGAPLPRIFE